MLNIVQVEAGHPGSTLALLWAVVSSRKLVSSCTLIYVSTHHINALNLQVKHYQFRQVCLATGLNPAPAPDILLLAWARSAPGNEQVVNIFLSQCSSFLILETLGL